LNESLEENHCKDEFLNSGNGNLNICLFKNDRRLRNIKQNSGYLTLSNTQINKLNNLSFRQCAPQIDDSSNVLTGLDILIHKKESDLIHYNHKASLNDSKAELKTKHNSNASGDDKNIEVIYNEEMDFLALSPSIILRNYNLNPYHNFELLKKHFIYQLKKSLLQAKKFIVNNTLQKEIQHTNNRNPNYYEIFSNYSQIITASVDSYEKYEDQNVKINNYFIRKNKILGKGGFSTVYICFNMDNNKEYVQY